MECLGWVAISLGLLFSSALLLIIWYWMTEKRLHQTFQKMGIKGPKPSFFLGNLDELLKKGPLECFKDWQKEYGNVFGVYRTKPFLVVTDVELMREVMVKNFNAFPNRQHTPLADYKPWNEMLTMLQNDHWKHVRKVLSPSFSTSKLKKMMPVMKRCCSNLVDNVAKKAASGEDVDALLLCNAFSMDVIAGTAFGIELDSLKYPDDPFLSLVARIRNVPQWMFTVLFPFPKLTPFWRRLGIAIAPEKDVSTLIDLIRTAIKQRRQGTEKYPDVLQLMLEAEDEGDEKEEVDAEIDHRSELKTSAGWTRKGLTESEIESNSFIFLIAGYENTALMMAFLLFELSAHPDCLRKVQEELDLTLGKKELNYQSVQELTYLEMCLNETMRLYPPGITLERECVEDTDLGGIHVPKGMHIVIPTYAIHVDPQHWPDPMTFDPERHTPEARATRHPFSFLPFGYGPRNCIGMRLVLVEMKMALAALLRQFSPVRSSKASHPPKMAKSPVLKPQDTLWIRLEARG